MATFTGTDLSDIIHPDVVSQGVSSVPAGVRPGAAGDFIFGRDGDDLLDGAGGADEIHGDLGDDTLFGGAGADLLLGGPGNDTIIGGAGADEMRGGDGFDDYYVDDLNDTIIDPDTFQGDHVFASVSFTLPGDPENLSLIGNARDGTGNDKINLIEGNQLENRLDGRGRLDTLRGFGGRDILLGGDEFDQLFGGGGQDTLRGQASGDQLFGRSEADVLIGGLGNDLLSFESAAHSGPGSLNRDIVRGGDGAPAFEDAGDAVGDHLVFEFDANLTLDGSQRFIFGGTGAGRLSVAGSGTSSLVRGNIDADPGFELMVLIEDGAVRASAYTREDFLL